MVCSIFLLLKSVNSVGMSEVNKLYTQYAYWYNGINIIKCAYKGGERMTRLELLAVLLSIKALLESDNSDKALELINEVIAEAKGQAGKTE